MKRTFLLSLLASMALVNANEIELPKMTIDAHHDSLDVPSSSASVTAQTINESINIINTEDAVKYLPSIHIRKRYIGDRNGIIATRTSGTLSSAHSLVYADGVLLSNLLGNSYAFPPRWSMVNPEEIERIDVLYGPFLAQYPGNSIGNTLLITTQMPQKFQAHFDVQGFIEDYELYGTRESYKGGQGSLSVGNKNGDVTWALSYNHLDSTSHPMSYATFSPSTINATGADKIVTGYYKDLDPSNKDRIVVGATSIDHTVQDTAKLKLAYDITPTASIMYTLGLWENDSQGSFDSYLRDSNGATVQTGTVNIEGKRYNLGSAFKNSITQQQHLMNALSFKTTTLGEWDVEAVASMYDYTTDESRTQNTSGSTSGTITDQDGTGWKTLDVIVDYRPHYAKEHLLKLGAHMDRYELASQTDNTADWENGSALSLNSRFGGTTQTNALFAQDAWSFAPNYQLVVGGRYEEWSAKDGTTVKGATVYNHPQRNEEYFSPKISLEYAIQNWLLRGGVGRAVRFPTVSELFQGSFNGSNVITNNDPNLKPEDAISYELSASAELDGGMFRASVFVEDLKDALYTQTYINSGGGTTTNIQNIDQILSKGIELAYMQNDAIVTDLTLQGSVTYVDSKVKKNDLQPLYVGKKQVRVPDWRATAVATYHQTKNFDYSVACRYSGEQFNTLDNTDPNGDTYGGTSTFFIVDAKTSYKFENGLGLSAGVDNINNDKAYAFHPYNQRTFFLRAAYDF